MEAFVLLQYLGSGSLGYLILKILLNAAALFGAAYLLRGVQIEDFTRAVILALILALLNATIGALLYLLTSPLRWLTLGLFSLIIDAIVLMLADYIMKGFKIKSFVWAVALAAVLAIFNAILSAVFL